MIYCNLMGGLGNILFQIAATKSLSIKKNTDCSFPNFISHLQLINTETNHNPNLKHADEYLQFIKINTESPKSKLETYEYPFEYSDFIPDENDFFIKGYFQTEKYFINCREEILQLFYSDKINNLINAKYSFINSINATSIHVRRGDYLKYPNRHPVLDINYYEEALKYTKQDLIIVFSDDIEWCKNNIKHEKTLFIVDEKDYIELFLMSKCKNNIISNSSFSWWGAWLNRNINKTVIAPRTWVGAELDYINTNDIICKGWIKL